MNDRRLIEALVRLEHNADFGEVMKWLDGLLDEARKDNAECVPAYLVRRAQGKVTLLTDIIGKARGARSRIDAQRG